ncbi:MAG: hypothetical protein ACOY4O_05715 [Pseudomonadota bacterium]
MSTGTMFASQSIAEHVLRGVIGVGALGIAIAIAATHPWASLALGVVMLVAFRGCPMCWTIGLIETVRGRISASRRI